MSYWILRGTADIADNEAGPFLELGEMPQLELMIEEQRATNYATSGPLNQQDLSVTVQIDVKGSLTVKESDAAKLELAVFGEKTAVAGGAQTAQAFPAGITAGQKMRLPGNPIKVSAVAVHDSAVGPVTLVAGTDYKLDPDAGMITFFNVTGFTQPFKADYTEAAHTDVAIATKVTPYKHLIFRGINIADAEKPVIAEFYHVRFGPAKKVSMKMQEAKEVTSFEYDLEFIVDLTKTNVPPLGRFGRIRNV